MFSSSISPLGTKMPHTHTWIPQKNIKKLRLNVDSTCIAILPAFTGFYLLCCIRLYYVAPFPTGQLRSDALRMQPHLSYSIGLDLLALVLGGRRVIAETMSYGVRLQQQETTTHLSPQNLCKLLRLRRRATVLCQSTQRNTGRVDARNFVLGSKAPGAG